MRDEQVQRLIRELVGDAGAPVLAPIEATPKRYARTSSCPVEPVVRDEQVQRLIRELLGDADAPVLAPIEAREAPKRYARHVDAPVLAPIEARETPKHARRVLLPDDGAGRA